MAKRRRGHTRTTACNHGASHRNQSDHQNGEANTQYKRIQKTSGPLQNKRGALPPNVRLEFGLPIGGTRLEALSLHQANQFDIVSGLLFWDVKYAVALVGVASFQWRETGR